MQLYWINLFYPLPPPKIFLSDQPILPHPPPHKKNPGFAPDQALKESSEGNGVKIDCSIVSKDLPVTIF
jgi:hypothetical protein